MPATRIAPPATSAGLADITTSRGQGGNFLGVDQARGDEVSSQRVGAPEREWGHVELFEHGLALDACACDAVERGDVGLAG